jgi:hypothetical protein
MAVGVMKPHKEEFELQIETLMETGRFEDPAFWFDSDEDPLVDYLMTKHHKIHSIVFLGFMIHTFLYFADLLLHLLPTGKVGWWVRHLLFGSSRLGDFAINLIAMFATYSVQAAERAEFGSKVWSKKYYLMGVIFTVFQILQVLISVVTFGPLRLIKKYVLDYVFEFVRFVNWACVSLYVTIHVFWLDAGKFDVFENIGKAFAAPSSIRPGNLLERASKVAY